MKHWSGNKMTDKEILDEVYRMCCNPFERCDVKSFIEQEWQKQDEQSHPETVPSFSKSWYMDAKEMERHRGLEIGPDGTVESLK